MKNQWETYKELELVGDEVLEPQTTHSVAIAKLSQIWRSLSNRYATKLSDEQQLEHLEKCLTSDKHQSKNSAIWRTIWAILNQPLFEAKPLSSYEPEIRQILDRSGRVWWYAYDPIIGQTTYLESEEEALIWLEERLQNHF